MMCPMFKQQQSSKQVRLTFKTGSHKVIINKTCGELFHLMQPPIFTFGLSWSLRNKTLYESKIALLPVLLIQT